MNGITTDWSIVAAAWDAHRRHTERSKQPTTTALLAALQLTPGDRVLELGAGTGELARMLVEQVRPDGHVLATDLAVGMVELARQTLADLPQAEVAQMGLEHLDLPDASVDAVVCRMGLMFTREPLLALKEVRRVLAPGGRLAVAVWAAMEHNPWITTVGISTMLHGILQGGPPVGPGEVFSLGDPKLMSTLLENAGFTAVDVLEVPNPFAFTTTEEHFDSVSGLAAPLARALADADETTREAARRTAAEAAAPYLTPGGLVLPGLALVASGTRP